MWANSVHDNVPWCWQLSLKCKWQGFRVASVDSQFNVHIKDQLCQLGQRVIYRWARVGVGALLLVCAMCVGALLCQRGTEYMMGAFCYKFWLAYSPAVFVSSLHQVYYHVSSLRHIWWSELKTHTPDWEQIRYIWPSMPSANQLHGHVDLTPHDVAFWLLDSTYNPLQVIFKVMQGFQSPSCHLMVVLQDEWRMKCWCTRARAITPFLSYDVLQG